MPCHVCPVADSPSCLGRIHASLCRSVEAGQRGIADQLVAIARVRDGRDAPPPQAGPGPDLDTLRMRADTCLWADPLSPCGCGGPAARPRICTRPGRPREVRRPYCLECASRADWDGERQ